MKQGTGWTQQRFYNKGLCNTAPMCVCDLLERHTAMQPGQLQHIQQHRLHNSGLLGFMKQATILHKCMLNLVLYWEQRCAAGGPNSTTILLNTFFSASESSDLEMISS
jgi:hypothetical protein